LGCCWLLLAAAFMLQHLELCTEETHEGAIATSAIATKASLPYEAFL